MSIWTVIEWGASALALVSYILLLEQRTKPALLLGVGVGFLFSLFAIHNSMWGFLIIQGVYAIYTVRALLKA